MKIGNGALVYLIVLCAIFIAWMYFSPREITPGPNQYQVISISTNNDHGPVTILAKLNAPPTEREKRIYMSFALDQIEYDTVPLAEWYGLEQPAYITIDTTGQAPIAKILFANKKQRVAMTL